MVTGSTYNVAVAALYGNKNILSPTAVTSPGQILTFNNPKDGITLLGGTVSVYCSTSSNPNPTWWTQYGMRIEIYTSTGTFLYGDIYVQGRVWTSDTVRGNYFSFSQGWSREYTLAAGNYILYFNTAPFSYNWYDMSGTFVRAVNTTTDVIGATMDTYMYKSLV